jgi:hypothetical protein
MGCASGKENAAAPAVRPKASGSSTGSPKVDCDIASTISPQGSDMDVSNLSSISFESEEGSPRLEVKGGRSLPLAEAVSKLRLRIEEGDNTQATEELQHVKQSITQLYWQHEKERKHGADRQRALTSKQVGSEERNMKKSKQTFKKGEN